MYEVIGDLFSSQFFAIVNRLNAFSQFVKKILSNDIRRMSKLDRVASI